MIAAKCDELSSPKGLEEETTHGTPIKHTERDASGINHTHENDFNHEPAGQENLYIAESNLASFFLGQAYLQLLKKYGHNGPYYNVEIVLVGQWGILLDLWKRIPELVANAETIHACTLDKLWEARFVFDQQAILEHVKSQQNTAAQ